MYFRQNGPRRSNIFTAVVRSPTPRFSYFLERFMRSRTSRRFATLPCGAVLLFTILQVPAIARSTVRVIHELKHDVSRPLAELGRMTPAQPNPFSPRLLKVLPTKPVLPTPQYAVPDAALQEQLLPQVSATLGLNFEGLGQGQYGFVMEAAPPDTNGAVARP